MVIFCEASVSAQSSTSMGVLRSASLLLGMRGKALDVESSTQGRQGVAAMWRFVSGLGALCVGPRLSVRARPSLCWSTDGALCVGLRRSVSGPGPNALCLGVPRSVCCHPSGPRAASSYPRAIHLALRATAPSSDPCASKEPQTLLFGGQNRTVQCNTVKHRTIQ